MRARRFGYPVSMFTLAVGVGLIDDIGLQLAIIGGLGVTVSLLYR